MWKGGPLQKRYITLVLFLLFVMGSLTAQDITFHHLTTDEGLSQTSVVALYKDEIGFIWIGTREGLNCYNGNGITTYKLRKNDPNSLFCNNVLRITGDQNGKIYILTTEGLCVYDMKLDIFTTLWKDVDITAVHYNKTLYIGKGREVYTLNTETSGFELYYRLPSPKMAISSLFIDDNDVLYIGTESNGLFTLKNKTTLKNLIPINSNISSVYQDSAGDIWVGSWEHGLYLISKDSITNFTSNLQESSHISSNFVRACCEDNQGNIWIGTFNGLDKYDKRTKQFSHYKGNDKPDGLTHSSIWCIIKDHQGTLWLGTYFGGVNYFNPEYEIYTWYKPSITERNGLSSPIVGRMIEDRYKNLWICTEGGGVNVYNKTTKAFKWYRPDSSKNSISQNNVKSIYYDEKNDLMWLGTHLGGLNRLDLKTDRFTHYRHNRNDSASIPSDIVRDIEPYGGKLILATDNGVGIFDPQTGKSSLLFKDSKNRNLIKNVFDVYVDHRNTLWIAVSGEGVFAYNMETEKLVNYRHDPSNPKSISNNSINSIAQDSYNNLYFSTSGRGLDMYHYGTDDFENFDSQGNGLSSDCVYNVCESTPGELLVITNQGFSKFNLETARFHNYSILNGFPLSAVNENALYLTSDQEIFLGGMQGMVSFHEEGLDFSKKPYNIVFSRLYINGEEVRVGDETGVLHNSFSQTQSITLKSNHSIVGLEFAMSNFIPANKDNIVYRLEGFSDEWTAVRDQNMITYTNLNPGQYTLVVKSNSPDAAHSHEARLNIEVLPPFYKTTIAYLIYLITIAAILYYLIRSYKQRVKLQASLEYEQKHLQDIENLNQTKLRFFTNISHEFRTPLTLIIGQLESLLNVQRFTPAVYNKILKIYNNSLQLKELISELLDFRKQEQGHMKITVSEHDIVDFLYGNYLLFEEYAKTKEVTFIFEKDSDAIYVWYDQKQLQKVLNNLLSNAFKYTKEGDTITIAVSKKDDEVIIEVRDTGIGISPEDIGKIFDRFYQADRLGSVNAGTGIGLALSKGIVELHHGTIGIESSVNQGSVFSIALKLGKEHFTPDQISEQSTLDIDANNAKPDLPQFVEDEAIDETLYLDKHFKGAKMLIVEDNDSLREMLVGIFEPFYDISTAADGEEGWEKVQAEQPNIVVSDIVMPKMTGTELCKAIKTNIDTCHIPVVLLTAKASIEYNLEGLRIGADDYIAKPFNVSILISRCNNLVNSRIVLQEKFSKQPQATPQMLATNALDKAFLDKATSIVEKHMENPEFSVNDFAAEMGMSRSKLFTKLKAIAGQTPNDFILIIRLKKAALLLRNNPELSISDISVIVGFNSPRYFSKCFKDMYHVRPLSYRDDDMSDETNESE